MAVTKIVAQDGSAQYKDVQTAIDDVPVGNKERVVIEVKPGIFPKQRISSHSEDPLQKKLC